jgi:hypothetical protein
VIGCAVAGEWDGDDWCMVQTIPFAVHLCESAEETAKAIVESAERELEPIVAELTLADNMLNVLAGWNDEKGNSLPEGQPGEGSIAAQIEWIKENTDQEGNI